VGPEAPLAAGIVDYFQAAGLPIVGPTRAAARIESSKIFAKQVMMAAGIPTADWQAFDDADAALAYVRAVGRPLVVKADGLAGGKGVAVCRDRDEAEAAVLRLMVEGQFGAAGRRVVIEERLHGEELSALVATDGHAVRLLLPARDHKRLLEGDRGPNTGGMGAVAPAPLDAAVEHAVTRILERTIEELARRGTPFTGILYAGLMLTADGPKVLEFNCRLGDPEAQVVLPLLVSDPVEMLLATATERVHRLHLRWHPGAAVGIVLAGGRYPDAAERGMPIEGLDRVDPDVLVFHSGTTFDGGRLLTAGGRVCTVVARGDSIDGARERALAAAEQVRFAGKQYRRDIGRSLAPLPVTGGAPAPDERTSGPVRDVAARPRVGIVVGSDSDLPVVEEAARVLRQFGVPFETTIASAHRSPERARRIAQEAEGRGWRVIIAAAGGAAHLAGALAAHTVLPVIGVPLDATPLRGLDALLATAQMPPGVPVATMAIGAGGLLTAALLAAQILAVADDDLRRRLHEEKARLARAVEEKAAALDPPAERQP
jgi:phosphoribosylamine--glycine ligase